MWYPPPAPSQKEGDQASPPPGGTEGGHSDIDRLTLTAHIRCATHLNRIYHSEEALMRLLPLETQITAIDDDTLLIDWAVEVSGAYLLTDKAHEAKAQIEKTLAQVKDVTIPNSATLHQLLMFIYEQENDFGRACTAAQHAADHLEQYGSERQFLTVRGSLCMQMAQQGDPHTALTIAQETYSAYKAAGHKASRSIGEVIYALAEMQITVGLYEDAAVTLAEMTALAQENQDTILDYNMSYLRIKLYRCMGMVDHARESYAQCAAYLDQLDEVAGGAWHRRNLLAECVRVQLLDDAVSEAQRTLHQLIALNESEDENEDGDGDTQSPTVDLLSSMLAIKQGDFDKAEHRLDRLIASGTAKWDEQIEAHCLRAHVAFRSGRIKQAETWATIALEEAERSNAAPYILKAKLAVASTAPHPALHPFLRDVIPNAKAHYTDQQHALALIDQSETMFPVTTAMPTNNTATTQ